MAGETAGGTKSPALRIRSPRDFWGGLALAAFAAFALWAASDLASMRGAIFGAGTAPRLFAVLLIVTGLVVALIGLVVEGPALPSNSIRGPGLVVIAIVCFALLIRPLGIFLTTLLTSLIASLGSKETRLIEMVLGAVLMAIVAVVLFHYLLGLALAVWPDF